MNILEDNKFQEAFSEAWELWLAKNPQHNEGSPQEDSASSGAEGNSSGMFGSAISTTVTTSKNPSGIFGTPNSTNVTSAFSTSRNSPGIFGTPNSTNVTPAFSPMMPNSTVATSSFGYSFGTCVNGSTLTSGPFSFSLTPRSEPASNATPEPKTAFGKPTTPSTTESQPPIKQSHSRNLPESNAKPQQKTVIGTSATASTSRSQPLSYRSHSGTLRTDSSLRKSKEKVKSSQLKITEGNNHFGVHAILNSNIKSLFANGRYEECIKCIEYVPNFYNNKAYVEYLIKSYIAINDVHSGKSVTNMYIEMQTTDKDKDDVKNWSNPMLAKIRNQQLCLVGKFSLPDLLQSPNPSFPNVSNKTTLGLYAPDGYGMKSVEDIEAGEIILYEEPYASIGSAKCAHCFLDTFLRTICSVCTSTYYCTQQCKNDDKKTHRWICPFLKKNNSATVNVKLTLSVFLNGLKTDFKDIFRRLELYEQVPNNLAKFLLFSKCFKAEHDLLDKLTEDACILTSYIINTPKLFARIKSYTSELKLCDNKVTELLGQIILRLLVVCELRGFFIFDDVLGRTTELFPFLSLLQINCEPNTIICRVQNKIILKALKDIPKGERITCGFFEMANTTYRKVFFDVFNLSLLNERCSYSCRCMKFIHKPLDKFNMHIGARNDGKISQGLYEAQLQMKISEIQKCLSNKNCWNVEKAFELVKEINLDSNHLIFQLTCFEVIELKLYSDELNDLEKYLPIIMNIDNVQFFKHNHIDLYMILKQKLVSFQFMVNFPESLLNALISYMDFLKWFVKTSYPNQVMLKEVEIMYCIYRRYALHTNDNGLMNALEA